MLLLLLKQVVVRYMYDTEEAGRSDVEEDSDEPTIVPEE